MHVVRPRRFILGPIVAIACAACCAPASAATVRVIAFHDEDDAEGATFAAKLTAAAGEANRVRVTEPPSPSISVLIEDLGANLNAGSDCVVLDAHHARCAYGGLTRVIVYAGDRDDILLATPGTAIEAHGGSGSDHLTGANHSDRLYGDGGLGDLLVAGGGYDLLSDGDGIAGAPVDPDSLDGGTGRDTVSYATRTAPVTINLGQPAPNGQAGEGDTIVSTEDAVGGRRADRITGTPGANELDGGNGDDRISAGAGADTVTGGKGNDTIRCGAGLDRVNSAARDRSIDRLASSCERFKVDEIIDDPDYGGETSAISVRLPDVRRSGSTVIVPVRCERFGFFASPCVISGALYGRAGGARLATPIMPVRVRAQRSGNLRLRLTATGRRQVRRGQHFQLSINERNHKLPFPLSARARARALIAVR